MIPPLLINRYEVSLFPKDMYVSDLDDLKRDLENQVHAFTDCEFLVIPIPREAPRDIPRISISSKDKSIICNISFDKINIQWVNRPETSEYSISETNLYKTTKELSDVILRYTSQKGKIRRVGYIKEIFFEKKNPIEALNEIFIHNSPNNLRGFNFLFVFDTKIKSIPCNESVRLADGLKNTDKSQRVVMIMKDINTRPDQELSWSSTKIIEFLKDAKRELINDKLYLTFFK